MKLFSAIAAAALASLGSTSAHAALILNFPVTAGVIAPGASNLAAGSSNLYQLTTNVGPGQAFQAGPNATTVQGFGSIGTFNGNPVGTSGFYTGGPFELTYAYSGFTYSGFKDTNNNFLFTGGSVRIYFDSTPDAISISDTTFKGSGGATAFANAMGSYTDGELLFSGTGHGSGPITTNQTTTTTTTQQLPFAPTANFGCPTGTSPALIEGSSPLMVSCTSTTTTPVTISGITLAVSNNQLSGFSLFDVNAGLAQANFNHNTQFIPNPLPSTTGADLAISTTVASTGNCAQNGSNVTCLAGLTGSAFVTPTTVFIPEPSMLALFGLGMLGLGAVPLRRRSKAVAKG